MHACICIHFYLCAYIPKNLKYCFRNLKYLLSHMYARIYVPIYEKQIVKVLLSFWSQAQTQTQDLLLSFWRLRIYCAFWFWPQTQTQVLLSFWSQAQIQTQNLLWVPILAADSGSSVLILVLRLRLRLRTYSYCCVVHRTLSILISDSDSDSDSDSVYWDHSDIRLRLGKMAIYLYYSYFRLKQNLQ
jgi:hypothetical protein